MLLLTNISHNHLCGNVGLSPAVTVDEVGVDVIRTRVLIDHFDPGVVVSHDISISIFSLVFLLG